jgi:leucyl aminopeptidase
MLVRVVSSQPWEVRADVLAVPLTTEAPGDDVLSELDRRTAGAFQAYRSVGELNGTAWHAAMLRGGEAGCAWLLGMGVGPAAAFDRLVALRLGSATERRLAGLQVSRLAVFLPPALLGGDPDVTAAAMLVARGVVEGSSEPSTIYRQDVEDLPPRLDELVLIVPDGTDLSAATQAAERGVIIGEGSNRARRLAQRAANDVTPDVLADEATAIAREFGLATKIYGPEKAEKLGMGMFMAVGRGSDNPPRFIALRSGDRHVSEASGGLLALVGKGVTFDSGGISIKSGDKMDEMKMDKTGACTVLAAIATVSRLAPELPLMAVAPAVENMPGPHSTRPGDVVRALNGKTVDVINTDAEGRLILGDALTWAERQGATHLVDVATLTGAVERAFGKLITGGFGQPQAWWDQVAAAGGRQAERLWQIPLVDDYRADMDSWYADVTNSGTPDGSLVKSGMFLREFVTRPWAHLDIGGSAYLRRATPWAARGATGVMHATLVELALAGASALSTSGGTAADFAKAEAEADADAEPDADAKPLIGGRRHSHAPEAAGSTNGRRRSRSGGRKGGSGKSGSARAG